MDNETDTMILTLQLRFAVALAAFVALLFDGVELGLMRSRRCR